jgi:hypothetical protein
MPIDAHRAYIRDLVYLLRERCAEARRRSIGNAEGSDFEDGRAMAYVEVLSLMQHQADAFELPREELLLAGFDPECDPVDPPPPRPKSG